MGARIRAMAALLELTPSGKVNRELSAAGRVAKGAEV